jgi:UDP-glucose 4-epimerase
MRILVTGGAGFVGRHIVNRLLQKGEKVSILDNNSGALGRFSPPASLYNIDIRDRHALFDAAKHGFDACIHLAAKVSVSDSLANPTETVDVNVNGTLNVLEACASFGIKKFVFASSAAVYGNPVKLPITEKHTVEPLSPYGASKVAGEALVASFAGSMGVKSAISLRFFNIYGKGQTPQYAGVITKFMERLEENRPPIIYGDGRQTRDFVSVEDVALAIERALETDVNGAFNIGTGSPVTINRLARIMMRLYGREHLVPSYHEARNGDIEKSYADVAKAKRILKFAAKDDLESGLKRLILSEPSKRQERISVYT